MEPPLGHYYRPRGLSSSRLGYPLHDGDHGHACAQPRACGQVYVHGRAYDDPGRVIKSKMDQHVSNTETNNLGRIPP